jgi:hypothetical protein
VDFQAGIKLESTILIPSYQYVISARQFVRIHIELRMERKVANRFKFWAFQFTTVRVESQECCSFSSSSERIKQS